ncbi:MAG TPA: transmembrane HD family protein, partial [Sphingobacteriaceae bacterium]
MAKLKRNSHLILLRRYTSRIRYLMMALSIAMITFFLPKQARFRFEYEKGKVWMHKDLYSPYNYSIQKSQDEIETDRREVQESLQPIYQLDAEVMDKVLLDYESDFEAMWNTAGEPERLKDDYKRVSTRLLNRIYEKGVLTLNKKFQRENSSYNFTLLTNNVATELNTQDVFTPESARQFILT